MFVLLLAHVTFWFVALAGKMVCISCSEPPLSISVMVFLFSVIPVTGVGFTVTKHVAVWPPSSVLTVMAALPVAMAVTRPLFTVAMALLLVSHETAWFVALAG